VLMVGYMDAEALAATIASGEVHFHSRSRDRLWRKGETSGNVLRFVDLAVDCDGDALLVTVEPVGPTCHRGTRSCFDPAQKADAATTTATTATIAATAATGSAVRHRPADQGFVWLETLWSTIAARATERPSGSYTATLLGGGVDAAGRKVTEEATEVLIAAKDDATLEAAGADRSASRAALAGETADLVYHALVLLAERDLPPAAVIDTLRTRHAR
jgi:phosphoribosyl-AMP cyclohydrolase / phosphoribosyl-ATP pyrophosphohydrolase